jgi:glyoxylase-like metal-dependent hydrolase (beta-lactamase superfamily II)
MQRIFLLLILFSGVAAGQLAQDTPFRFEFEELAPGVWAGVRPDSPRFPVMGNATFVISNEGVVVFDGGGMPAMAEQIIDKVRSITDKPVTHVVISHWHGDHNFGVFRFAEEYPNVQFVAHEFTNDVFHSSRIHYIDRQSDFINNNLEEFQKIVDTGVDSDGTEYSDVDRRDHMRIIDDADAILAEYGRARVTPADVTFADSYTIESGDRRIELLHLGHANTAGDIVMWLPDERIVSTGDIVVLPSPYAFNVPPRAWAATLRELNNLDYKMLVPGHGAIQNDTSYVDLVIEASEYIADQRDALLADGMSSEEVEEALDLSAFENRFTHGDEYVKSYYDAYFDAPFKAAAMKALTGEPMVAIEPPVSVQFDDERWEIDAVETELVDYLGQAALKIKGGSALLPDLDIKNGLVEFDIAVAEERGFAGLVFRVQDEGNYEHFYIRPHQSGNPDANQYTPVYNGVSAWQLYHGSEYAAPIEYRFNEWMHVKIVYAGKKADVYIDSDEPVLRINNLRRDELSGATGLHSGNFSSVHFANFKYTVLADAYALPSPEHESATHDGTVMKWQVSDAFDAGALEGVPQLTAAHTEGRMWTSLNAEESGITNLAQVQGIEQGKNTVFARVVLSAGELATKKLSFGYSDAANVYLNGTLIYAGDNTYQSRDYRHLGTIGLFDSVVLPLKLGENELWIAVAESFGGWGVQARIDDL